jgi:hypothetical protein
MIKFDPYKEKKINFTFTVQGIDPNLLEYNLRISTGNIDYGFKGTNKNGTILFNVPPLNEVMNIDVINSLNIIKLEVNDKNNKYYLKPFEDHIKIEKTLTMEAEINEEEQEKEDLFSIDVELNEVYDNKDVKVDKKEKKEDKKTVKPKKKISKFGSYLKE